MLRPYDFRKLNTKSQPSFSLRNIPRPFFPTGPLIFNYKDMKTIPHKDIIGSYRTKAVYLSNGKISVLVDARELS